MSEPRIQAHLEASDAVVAWCLRSAARMERLGEIEQAGLWGWLAAVVAANFGHSQICSVPIESLLLRLGNRLPCGAPPAPAGRARRPLRWLHVFSVTGAIGGHTAIARRWVARNPFGQQHSVVLTVQRAADIDVELAAAVRRSGGEVRSLAGAGTFFQGASALRQLAWEQADVVVLHVHNWDVLPTIAFAVPGGPPVLLMNHADHGFWVGCAISDVVVDIRDSGLSLSLSFRGARDSAVLPVPLEDHGPAARTRSLVAARLRDPSVLARGLVLLTIGGPQKYQALPYLDFPRTIGRIVDAIDDCALIAVGASPDDAMWRQLAERTGGRIVAVGPDPDLAPWHAAADLYLEGFPVGSYTALLEVALAARAFVRKPYLMPLSVLPIDRGALATFEPPVDPDAYVAAAVALARDPGRRESLADEARHAVLAVHCGARWDARLEALHQVVPARHDVGFGVEPQPTPRPLAEYWAAHFAARSRQSPLDFALRSAERQRLRPRLDLAVLEAMRPLQDINATDDAAPDRQ